MTKKELREALDNAKLETKQALQLVFDTLNNGQQKKILKEDAIVGLFDRYGVEYEE